MFVYAFSVEFMSADKTPDSLTAAAAAAARQESATRADVTELCARARATLRKKEEKEGEKNWRRDRTEERCCRRGECTSFSSVLSVLEAVRQCA